MDWINTIKSVYGIAQPVLDILILSFLVYKCYELLVRTQAFQLIKGAGFLVLIYAFAYFLKLSTLQWILNLLAPGLLIAIAIVFQPELRKIIIQLGQGELFNLRTKPRLSQIDAAVTAAEILANQKRGALVVFPRKMGLRNIAETGTRLNAELSSSLIITIFAYDGPLHDGAILVENGKISAAGCFLPLSEQQDIRKSFGTRHRAALGMSEQSDAVILIVSEETGAMSLAYDSKLYYDLSSSVIQKKLREFLDSGEKKDSGGDKDELKESFFES